MEDLGGKIEEMGASNVPISGVEARRWVRIRWVRVMLLEHTQDAPEPIAMT